jgi:hypothetical protein
MMICGLRDKHFMFRFRKKINYVIICDVGMHACIHASAIATHRIILGHVRTLSGSLFMQWDSYSLSFHVPFCFHMLVFFWVLLGPYFTLRDTYLGSKNINDTFL